MSPLDQVIVAVMTKVPQAGRVKTRLIGPLLSPEDAANVHRLFVMHVIHRLQRLRPVALVVAYDPPENATAMRALLNDFHCTIDLIPQCAGDLGARLAHATATIRDARGGSAAPILFFGVDSPDVPIDHVQRAAGALSRGSEVVVGPSEDGGYWCLGLGPRVDACKLLCDIAWSSGRERAQTLARAQSLGYTTAAGPAWDDVDHPADLSRLIARLRRSSDADDRELLAQLADVLPKEVLS